MNQCTVTWINNQAETGHQRSQHSDKAQPKERLQKQLRNELDQLLLQLKTSEQSTIKVRDMVLDTYIEMVRKRHAEYDKAS